jgi:hypothetical protein
MLATASAFIHMPFLTVCDTMVRMIAATHFEKACVRLAAFVYDAPS